MKRPLGYSPARMLAATSMLLVVAIGSGACSTEDRSAVAAAKCALPVAQEAGFSDDSAPRQNALSVTDLGHGSYRVTGHASSGDDATSSVTFVCEVAPDTSDKLRGFKVTHLEVHPN